MASWQATDAKAKFSALLDAAAEGPQTIRRRKKTYVLQTEEELEQRLAEAREGKPKKFVSAWDALRPPASWFEEFGLNDEFPRVNLDPRPVDFE